MGLAAGCSWLYGDDDPGILPFPEEIDIPYGDARGCNSMPLSDENCGGSQELDIYRSDDEGPNPVALFLHSGGFVSGDKSKGVNEHFDAVLDAGWDIVAVNYRLAMNDGTNLWPVPLLDVKQAVRWVKANAEAQDWDPERVAAIGHSAGGNLAGMLATTANEPALEPVNLPPPLGTVDSSIIGAVAIAPVSDLATYRASPFGHPVATYLGCDNCPEQMAAGSVQTHVDASSAPMLAIHGSEDVVAQPSQGEAVRDAYEAAGIGDRFELIVVEDGDPKYRNHNPDISRWADDIVDFLDEVE